MGAKHFFGFIAIAYVAHLGYDWIEDYSKKPPKIKADNATERTLFPESKASPDHPTLEMMKNQVRTEVQTALRKYAATLNSNQLAKDASVAASSPYMNADLNEMVGIDGKMGSPFVGVTSASFKYKLPGDMGRPPFDAVKSPTETNVITISREIINGYKVQEVKPDDFNSKLLPAAPESTDKLYRLTVQIAYPDYLTEHAKSNACYFAIPENQRRDAGKVCKPPSTAFDRAKYISTNYDKSKDKLLFWMSDKTIQSKTTEAHMASNRATFNLESADYLIKVTGKDGSAKVFDNKAQPLKLVHN